MGGHLRADQRGRAWRRRVGLLLSGVMLAATAVSAGVTSPVAAATTGPAIVHAPTTTAPYGRPIVVTATATCESGAGCAARLFYRTTTAAATTAVPGIVEEGGFQMAPMTRGTATTAEGREAVTWSAVIPGAAVTTAGVDYFVEAEDDGALSRYPGSTTVAGTTPTGSFVHVHVLTPPLLHHVPVPFVIAGRAFDVDAHVACADGCTATLHYRRTPATVDPAAGWSSTTMQPQGTATSLGDAGVLLAYRARVPADSVDTTGVDYYIHVADGHTQAFSPGTTYQGWYAPRDGARVPAAVHHVHVVEPPRIVHVPPATAPYGADIPISARANCAAAKQCEARLFYRTTTPGILSATAFAATAMSVTRMAGVDGIDVVIAEAVVPAAVVDTRGIDYFVSVTDGTSTSWWPGTTPVDGPGVWVDGVRVVYQHVHVQEPVHVTHLPAPTAPVLEDLVVTAEVTCATPQCAASVHYTTTPALPGTYRTLAMERTFVATTSATRVERWLATIPAGDVTTRGVAYYFTATDGHTSTAAPGTSYWGAYVVVDGGPVSPETARFVVRVVEPPHLAHAPVLVAVEGEDLRIEARSNCATSCPATLHWRVTGSTWQSEPMVASPMSLQAYGNDVVAYTAVIDGAGVTPSGLEYRIEVHDGYVTETTPTYPVVVTARGLTRHSSGQIGFEGTARLPIFPCDRDPLAGSPCTEGSFSGNWSAHIGGTYGTSAFDVAWATASGEAISATFVYSEWDCFSGVETLLGFAQGSGSAVAEPGDVQGKWHVAGEALGRDITRVTMAFAFSWTRVLNAAQLVIEPTTLTVEVAGLGSRVVATGRQVGTAAFVVPVAGGTAAPTCDQPLRDVEGRIAGVVDVASSGAVG